jgi:hypothetical protein
MPSQPRAQACSKMVAPSPSKCVLKAIPSLVPRSKSASTALRRFERLPPKVLAVEFDQVEGTEHSGMVILTVADEVEDREPVLIDDNGLAVERA